MLFLKKGEEENKEVKNVIEVWARVVFN